MEFFEKAHVINKQNKDEEYKKKQLRQMLQGYKENNTDAIKSSANSKKLQYETFSMSSFSESDFLNNTEEIDKTEEFHDAVASETTEQITDSENTTLSLTMSSSENSQTEISILGENKSFIYCKKEEVTIPKDLSSDENQLLCSAFDNGNMGISSPNESSIETVSEDSQPFDPEGTLATKIKQKLGKRVNICEERKQIKKVKLDKIKKSEESWIVEDLSHLQISKPLPDKPTSSLENSSDISSTGDSSSSGSTCSNSQCSQCESSETGSFFETGSNSSVIVNDELENSEPFVSMQTPMFICGNLSDILSDYTCPISRGLTCEHKTIPVASSKIFTSDIVDTGLKESEPESDDFVDDYNINFDGSVIDELEMSDDIQHLISEETINLSDETINNEGVELPIDLENGMSEQVQVYYSKSGCCILVLNNPVKIYIHGKVRVTALGGTAEIQGFIMIKDKSCDVYAPYHSYSHYLKTVVHDNNNYGLFGKLTSSGLTVAEAEDIVTTMGDYDVVVKLEKLNCHKMDFVENNFSTDLFSKPNKYIDSCFKRASEILKCSLYLNAPWKCFEENPVWEDILRKTDEKSRGIITGGKGTGKSNFLRYSVNKLLSGGGGGGGGGGGVLLLDLDPGQSELAPPGCVSATLLRDPLLGPNFTHLKTPDMMLNIGMINVLDNTNRYINAVTSLLAHCASEPQYRDIPWLVNTMGLCNSVGLKIITLVILLLRPTFLVQMQSKTVKKRYEHYLDPHTIKRLYIERYQRNAWFRSIQLSDDLDFAFYLSEPRAETGGRGPAPRDERYLAFLAYFGELLEQHKDKEFLDIVPYKVPLQHFRIILNVKIPEEAITKVLNGKIVALCEDADVDNRRNLITLADKPLRCHGYGLVRCAEDATLYVSTPAARARLPAVRALLLAAWAPELRAERLLPAGTALPYRTASSSTNKQLMLTPRRRFNPLQLLKMSRSS